ncbi:MAG: hypothetical protein Q3972_06685 [Corynebacterium sp.]|nr:hypothetical protein [Corynebacterium sp.]
MFHPVVRVRMVHIRDDGSFCRDDKDRGTRMTYLRDLNLPGIQGKYVTNQPLELGDCVALRIQMMVPQRDDKDADREPRVMSISRANRIVDDRWAAVGLEVYDKEHGWLDKSAGKDGRAANEFLWSEDSYRGIGVVLTLIRPINDLENLEKASTDLLGTNLPFKVKREYSDDWTMMAESPAFTLIETPSKETKYEIDTEDVRSPVTEALKEATNLSQAQKDAFSSRADEIHKSSVSKEKKREAVREVVDTLKSLDSAIQRAKEARKNATDKLRDKGAPAVRVNDIYRAHMAAMEAKDATKDSVDTATGTFTKAIDDLLLEMELTALVGSSALSPGQDAAWKARIPQVVKDAAQETFKQELKDLLAKNVAAKQLMDDVAAEQTSNMGQANASLTAAMAAKDATALSVQAAMDEYLRTAEANGYVASDEAVAKAKEQAQKALNDATAFTTAQRKALQGRLDAIGTADTTKATKKGQYESLATEIAELDKGIAAIKNAIAQAQADLGADFDAIAADTAKAKAAAEDTNATTQSLAQALEDYNKAVANAKAKPEPEQPATQPEQPVTQPDPAPDTGRQSAVNEADKTREDAQSALRGSGLSAKLMELERALNAVLNDPNSTPQQIEQAMANFTRGVQNLISATADEALGNENLSQGQKENLEANRTGVLDSDSSLSTKAEALAALKLKASQLAAAIAEAKETIAKSDSTDPVVVAAREELVAKYSAANATANTVRAGIAVYEAKVKGALEAERENERLYKEALAKAKESASKKDTSEGDSPNLDGLSDGQAQNFENLIAEIEQDSSLSDEQKLQKLNDMRNRIDALIGQIERAKKAREETAAKTAHLTDAEKRAALEALDKKLADAASDANATAESVEDALEDYLGEIATFINDVPAPAENEPKQEETQPQAGGSSFKWWYILLIILGLGGAAAAVHMNNM